MIHRFALVLLAFALSTGCGVSKTVKKVKKAVTPSEVIEKVATGDVPGIVAIGFKVLNASQDYAVVHQDQGCLIAEVRKVPVLGLSLTGSKDTRYYLRIDTKTIKDAAGTVKMVFSFYKAAKGAFLEVMNPDSAVGKYAQQIFLHIIGALLKSGVAFK